ncbi:hypothetical protein [Companilactobacillus sp. HBUAS59544]|uniref:hypothetical protein n=1 Tax=Companilactobacillus sp. HBUAS59544 TaxID=3109363 RepID=UPI002FF3E80B
MLTQKQSMYEEDVLNRLSKYLGKTDLELYEYFKVRPNPLTGAYPNNVRGIVVNRMLDFDLKPEKAKEMRDFNITRYTLRVEKNGKIKESLSLPDFKFEDIVNETWEDCTLKNYLVNKRYLFIVFKSVDENSYQFDGAKFWTMPEKDLNDTVKEAWQQTVDTIKGGVILKYDEKHNRVENNFIGSSQKMIIHVRPHSAKRGYNSFSKNAYKLPVSARWTNKPSDFDDNYMTKQCFWLNNNYVTKQISDLI